MPGISIRSPVRTTTNPAPALNLHLSQPSDVTVTNALGQRVASFGSIPGEATPGLESLPKGLYLVTVRAWAEMQVLRWVKE